MAPELLCPFISAVEAQVCVGPKCQLWLTQYRQNEDGSRTEFSNCSLVVFAVTQMRQLTEQIRTTATVDGVKEAFMEAPKQIVSAFVRQRLAP